MNEEFELKVGDLVMCLREVKLYENELHIQGQIIEVKQKDVELISAYIGSHYQFVRHQYSI